MNDNDVAQTEVFSCPSCGAEIEYLASECNECGETLEWGDTDALPVNDEDFIICEGCHREIPRNSKFCSGCGKPVCINGLYAGDDETPRVLPRCPTCGEELDYGAKLCDACGSVIEWKSGRELLVSLESLQEKEIIPRQNKPRHGVDYGVCAMTYDTFTKNLKPQPARLTIPKLFDPPALQYNSFGEYSGKN